MKNTLTRKQVVGDAVICVLLLLLAVLFAVLPMLFAKQNTTVRVTLDGKEVMRLPLSQNLSDYSPDGHVHIRIENGRAFISDSDCPDKICLGMHGVDASGGSAVCIPNRVAIEAAGNVSQKKDNAPDAVAG